MAGAHLRDPKTVAVSVYRELLVDENTRKVELRYIDEATGREIAGLASGLQGLPATQPDLALFICSGFVAEQVVLGPVQEALPPVYWPESDSPPRSGDHAMSRSVRRWWPAAFLGLAMTSCSTVVSTQRSGGEVPTSTVPPSARATVPALSMATVTPTRALMPSPPTASPSLAGAIGKPVAKLVPPSPAPEDTPTRWAQEGEDAEAEPSPIPTAAPPNHLSIPAIGLEADVVALGWEGKQTEAGLVSVWDGLPANEAAWSLNSAAPGENSNVVISGHHNMAGRVFRDLVLLQPGDRVVVRAGGTDFAYVVSERMIVPERDVSADQRSLNATWMLPTGDERLTLITCWPRATNSHRLIVVAMPDNSARLALQ